MNPAGTKAGCHTINDNWSPLVGVRNWPKANWVRLRGHRHRCFRVEEPKKEFEVHTTKSDRYSMKEIRTRPVCNFSFPIKGLAALEDTVSQWHFPTLIPGRASLVAVCCSCAFRALLGRQVCLCWPKWWARKIDKLIFWKIWYHFATTSLDWVRHIAVVGPFLMEGLRIELLHCIITNINLQLCWSFEDLSKFLISYIFCVKQVPSQECSLIYQTGFCTFGPPSLKPLSSAWFQMLRDM